MLATIFMAFESRMVKYENLSSRIGSVGLEPVCKKFNLVQFLPYKDFVNASLKDDKINILSETNNTYRALLTVCLMLLLIKIYLIGMSEFNWLEKYMPFLTLICLIVLFAISYRKQTNYVRDRVKHINEVKQEGELQ